MAVALEKHYVAVANIGSLGGTIVSQNVVGSDVPLLASNDLALPPFQFNTNANNPFSSDVATVAMRKFGVPSNGCGIRPNVFYCLPLRILDVHDNLKVMRLV